MKLLYILIWIILQDLKLFVCGLVGLHSDLAGSTFLESLVKGWFFFFFELGLCASPSPLLSFSFCLCRLSRWLFKNEEPFHDHFAHSTELLLKSARRGCNRQLKGKAFAWIQHASTTTPPDGEYPSPCDSPSLTELAFRNRSRGRRARALVPAGPPARPPARPPACLSVSCTRLQTEAQRQFEQEILLPKASIAAAPLLTNPVICCLDNQASRTGFRSVLWKEMSLRRQDEEMGGNRSLYASV